ncbi:hypothetical protein [Mycobacterium hubeiense]|uniref:hypothetical protein n=1 Tax=Mycobacterium hubeiense TaxID=1867256 RepID=UPI001E29A1D5|nr:hypothetical protein [Mycobacterium sp. QGD 101]
MAHRLVVAYYAGRRAYPHTRKNPYAGTGDRTAARLWRLGWHRARDEYRAIPSEADRVARLAAEIDALLD